MKIEQKKLSNHHGFTFEADRLNFAYRDKTGSGDIDVPYAEFPCKSSTLIESNQWLRNVGYLWCALGVLQIVYHLYAGERPSGFWLLLGLGCLLWVRMTKVVYTCYRTQYGNVLVIQDGNAHDRIIEEILDRRRRQLLAMYGEVNPENSLEQEVGRIRWLEELQVFSREEAERRIAQLELLLGTAGSASPSVTIN
ncbi:MAG TPA: hypothetical protein PLN02_06180 [Azonexus sp.]|nr:hypothetical protein [Azonexus sp.]